MTLLEKAKAVSVGLTDKGRPSNEDLSERCELALAFLRGQITTAQARSALNISSNHLEGRVGSDIKSGIRKGIIKAELVK